MPKLVFLAFFLGIVTPLLAVVNVPTGEIDSGSFGCPSDAMKQTLLDSFRDIVEMEVTQNIVPNLDCRVGECQENPASSCQDVQDQGTGMSGWYFVKTCNGDTIQVYCTMDNPCGCNSTGAWARIGLLNMSDPTEQCPSGMVNISNPRSCSRNVQQGGCASLFFDSKSLQYSRVCGRAVGYGESSPDGFGPYIDNGFIYTIDDPYVDGMSVTYGFSPRKHIWTFAAGVTDSGDDAHTCPCSSTNWQGQLPPYIGADWFCEAGPLNNWQSGTIYTDNPLWDGMGCPNPLSTCCTANNPPWFCKDLPSPTQDNIEVRACGDQHQNDEDVLISLIELYVQ